MQKMLLSILLLGISYYASAQNIQVTSLDFKANGNLKDEQRSNTPGCGGKNISPELSWSGIPKSAKSIAITEYDPDAPTGSGFWHWIVYNIDIHTTSIPHGASMTAKMPQHSIEIDNDRGTDGYHGSCPPPGTGNHRYIFTVYALDIEQLKLPDDATSAMVRSMLHKHTIEKATITAYAKAKTN